MKKTALFSGAAAIIVAILLILFMDSPPQYEASVVNMNRTRLPVQFNHEAMQEVECVTCHHLVNGEENYSRCSSRGCHDILGSNARREVRSYYRITHEPHPRQYYSCMKCHLEVAARKPELKSGLTACSGSLCHPQ